MKSNQMGHWYWIQSCYVCHFFLDDDNKQKQVLVKDNMTSIIMVEDEEAQPHKVDTPFFSSLVFNEN